MIFFIIHCESETNLFSPFSLNLLCLRSVRFAIFQN